MMLIVSPSALAPVTSMVSGGAEGQGINGRAQVWRYVYAQFKEDVIVGQGPGLFPKQGSRVAVPLQGKSVSEGPQAPTASCFG